MTITELTERRELAHGTNDGIDVTLFWSNRRLTPRRYAPGVTSA
jgi:hypothetical protein